MLTLVRPQSRHNFSAPQPPTTPPKGFPPKPLTTDEVSEVNRATFREGYNHCRWPKEVIEKFLAQPV